MADKKNLKIENIDKMTFEQAIALLQEIVQKVETGQIGLEDAIGQYEIGCQLVRHCKQILEGAERKIELLSKGLDGPLSTQPFKTQADPETDDEGDDEK